MPSALRALRRLALVVPLFAGTATTAPLTACSVITGGGDKCKKACLCGAGARQVVA